VLIQAMDVLNLDEPDENYWYAFGALQNNMGSEMQRLPTMRG